MPPLLLELWREQHPLGHEQTALDHHLMGEQSRTKAFGLRAELQAGTPNYDLMSPGLADATRQQLTGIQSMLNGMGPLQSVIFMGVGAGGADIYQVNFEKASIDYRVWLSADGKVDSANMRSSDSPRRLLR
jgi:hypothetical protein